MSIVKLQSAASSEHPLRERVKVDDFELFADVSIAAGGTGSAPDPHAYFDLSIAACKALTLKLYARRKGWPLEDVEVELTSDASKEREGEYRFDVALRLVGPLREEQRKQLLDVASRCPIHKLMTTATISIDTRLVD